jgi:tetratricopeptide (TPR) repeat protein
LQSKKKIYLGGGASWCMAILEGDWEGGPPGPVTGPGSPVKLRPGTITRFMQRVIDKNADILQLEPKGLSKEQERELEGVRKRFGPKDKLVAAAAILGALADSLDLGNDEKVQVYFAPNSHLAWIQGYVESRVRKIISQTKALSPQDLERAVEQVRKELGEGNSQLKEVAAKLATLSEQLGKLADKASQAPPPVDLQPLLSELRGIREAINKKQTPNNGPVGRQNPPPVPPGVTPAGGDAFTASQHFNRALESYHDCQLEQALIHFDAATRADSYDPASWYGLAITQQRIGLKESARATAWRLAAAFQRDHEAYPSVCVPFERIQGTDRHAVDEYISQATADMMRGRPGPRSLSSVIPTWMKEQSPAAGADRR